MVELQPSKLVVWVRFPSPAPKKTDTRMGIGFLFVCIMGIEPERVAALNKQSGGLFVAGESLSDSESQSALAFGKSGDSHHLLQKIQRSNDLCIFCIYKTVIKFTHIHPIRQVT